jgi:hypothetical protein
MQLRSVCHRMRSRPRCKFALAKSGKGFGLILECEVLFMIVQSYECRNTLNQSPSYRLLVFVFQAATISSELLRAAIQASISDSRHILRFGLIETGSGKAPLLRNRQIVVLEGLPVRSSTTDKGISFSAINGVS